MAKAKWKTKAKDFVGIADCHGIESFMSIEDKDCNVALLEIRAAANPQRHAVVYKITLNEAQATEVWEELETARYSEVGDGTYHYKQIVRKFKTWDKERDMTKSLGYPPANLMVSNKKMWNKIPNSKLDPWN